METPYNVKTKVCSNGPGQMTKMAAKPIYGKNPLKIFWNNIFEKQKAADDKKTSKITQQHGYNPYK